MGKPVKDIPKTGVDPAEPQPARKSPIDFTKPPKIRIQKLQAKDTNAVVKPSGGRSSRSDRKEDQTDKSQSRESSRDSQDYQSHRPAGSREHRLQRSADTNPPRRRDYDKPQVYQSRQGRDGQNFRGNQRGQYGRNDYQYHDRRDRNNNSPYKPREDRDRKRSRSGSHGHGEDKRRDRRPTPPVVNAADAARDAKIEQMSKSIETLTALFTAQMQPKKR